MDTVVNNSSRMEESINLDDDGSFQQRNLTVESVEEALENVVLSSDATVDIQTQNVTLSKQYGVNITGEDTLTSEKNTVTTESQQNAPSLSQYFMSGNNISDVQGDPNARSFFDTLSSSSAMMSSLHEASVTEPWKVVDKEPKGTLPVTSTEEVVKKQLEKKISSDIHDSKANPQPSLSNLFCDDSTVQDREGKAFFDALAFTSSQIESVPVSNNPLPSSSSLATGFLRTPSVEDPFSTSLTASESDRRHDAWIPTAQTLKALINMRTSPPGTFFPERDQLTMPGIVLEEDLIDPVYEQLYIHKGEEDAKKRVTLTANNVSQDENGIRQLISAGCHRAAVNLTGRLLVLLGQGVGKAGHPTKITPQIIQIWYVRIALLVKLRQFNIAEIEALPFGSLDKPDLYYEFYPDIFGVRKGCMVPFAFRVVLAELPCHLGRYQEALDRLYAILATVQQILNNLDNGLAEDGSMIELSPANRKASQELWKKRERKVMYSILNCVLAEKDFSSAVDMVQTLKEKDSINAKLLLSLLGRIYLQLGNVKAAQESFNQASLLHNSSLLQDKVAELINSSLIEIAYSRFDGALQNLKAAQKLDPNNPVVINNMAVCLLYAGKLREALKLLEGAVCKDPSRFLHEGVLFNVCTLYELESSHSIQRKQSMLHLVASHLGDGFNITCLKLPNPTQDSKDKQLSVS